MNELCFCVNGEEIYLDKVLVDYEHVPVFFVCVSANGYYISLCTDIEQLSYILVKVSRADLYEMLQGHITMRNIILKQKYYYAIESGDDIASDVVTHKPIGEINKSILPDEGASFEPLTDELCDYVDTKSLEILVDGNVSLTKAYYVSWVDLYPNIKEIHSFSEDYEDIEVLVA